jgi:hypothetical protein
VRAADVTEIGVLPTRDYPEPPENDLGWHVQRITGRSELVLSKIQPGDYWVRVRAPGGGLTEWEHVRVGSEDTLFEPDLARAKAAPPS